MFDEPILTVQTAATSRALVTLARVKRELGITDQASDDLLTDFITEASALIDSYANRAIAQEAVQEVFRHSDWRTWRQCYGGQSHQPLVLRRWPIAAITSVTEDANDPLDPSLYDIDAEKGMLWRLDAMGNRAWWWNSIKVTVVYTGGYVVPDSAPPELQQACLTLIKHRWASKSRDPMLRSQDVPGVLVQSWWIPTGAESAMPPEVRLLVDPYRDTVI